MNKNILVVDDEPNVRLSYRMTLEIEGYEIFEANCGAKALEQLTAHAFELVLLDLRMPEMTGLQLLEKMRDRGFTTPTVIITAHGDVTHAVHAMKLGAIDFLQKPLTPQQLRQAVVEVIERHDDFEIPESKEDLSVAELHRYYLIKAKRLLNLQEFGPARKVLGEAMELDPLSAEAFNLAGVLFEMQENYDRAKKYYAQAVKLDKANLAAQQNLRRINELCEFGTSQEPFSFGKG